MTDMPVIDLLAALLAVTALALAAALGVLLAAQALAQTLAPIRPVRFRRDLQLPPESTPAQLAALDDLQALGFHLVWRGLAEFGEQPIPAAFLAQPDGTAFANIVFEPGAAAGYPTAFYSIDAQDRLLATVNRTQWRRASDTPPAQVADALARNLADHWRAHRQRAAAAQPVDFIAARDRVWALLEGYLDRMLASRRATLRGGAGYLRPAAALRNAWAWVRAWPSLARPYGAGAAGMARGADYFVEYFEFYESRLQAARAAKPAGRPDRAYRTYVVLAGLALLGSRLDWRRFVALVAVFALYRTGRSLARRALAPENLPGWRFGARVLAGPLPGLALGLGLLAMLHAMPLAQTDAAPILRELALVAIAFNSLMLLPVAPLPGGQLLELALLTRRPLLRLLLALGSVCALGAASALTHSLALFVLAVLLLAVQFSRMRELGLDRALRDGMDRHEELAALFAVLHDRRRIRSPLAQWGLARNVLSDRRRGRPPLLAGLLVLSLLVLIEFHALRYSGRDFVRAGWVSALAPPMARSSPTDEEARRSGQIAQRLLELYLKVRDAPASERAARLRQALAETEQSDPGMLAPTVDARLRLAEAIDEAGDRAAADSMLRDLRRRSQGLSSCRIEFLSVARAEVWFHLQHREFDEAIAIASAPPLQSPAGRATGSDLAWALLLAGRTAEGLEQMRASAYLTSPDPGWAARLWGRAAPRPQLIQPLDLAHALGEAGYAGEARALLSGPQSKWQCLAGRQGAYFRNAEPWQQERGRRLQKAATDYCPPNPMELDGTR